MTSRSPATKFVDELLKPYPGERTRFSVVSGTKHEKLMLDGRVLMVVPRTPDMRGWHARNARALVRRALRC